MVYNRTLKSFLRERKKGERKREIGGRLERERERERGGGCERVQIEGYASSWKIRYHEAKRKIKFFTFFHSTY